jgi:PAS domain S-box-containing protein
MQIYLLAANLFALAALFLGFGNFSKGKDNWRLVPLFILVICRSLSLIVVLTGLEQGWTDTLSGLLEIGSTLCIIWALSSLTFPWPKAVWVGVVGSLILTLLPLIPTWPVPIQIHIIILAICGVLFLALFEPAKIRWPHLGAPLMLALANFLILLDLPYLAWWINLLAYVLFISAIHWESIQAYHVLYRNRQHAAEAMVQEAIDLSREQQRWIEASELINASPNLNQSMEHIVRSMAQLTHTDQSAIFMFDTNGPGQMRLASLYSPERPVHLAKLGQVVFNLDSCPPLHIALSDQQPLLLSQANGNGLSYLYGLWHEDRAGPTLIQPLAIRGRPVGALVLGNPVTHRPLKESDQRLCRTLAPQLATMVEHRRRYLQLEAEAETILSQAQNPPNPLADQLPTLEVINEGVVVSDASGRVQLANRAAERILGKTEAELLNQPIGSIYGAIDSSDTIENLAAAFSRRNQPLPTFFEDDERAIQGSLIPWRNQHGEWRGIIALFRDVTREIKADKARNDFIAALSRELRAPLTAIKGYSDLIVQGAWQDYSAEQLRVQQIIQSSAEQMAGILDNAIQITVQNRHKVLPRFEEVEVAKVIEEVLQHMIPLIRVRELTLKHDIRPDLPTLIADPKHIQQILNNLLSNACRFTPPGGKVSLRAWVQMERAGRVERPHLLLMVADNGIGIPRSEQKRIFNPFYQLKQSSIETDLGMGMGLAVVKDLVELHNGRVWVESMVGQGSMFYVALPLTQD